MSQIFVETITLEKDTCGRCGGTYALNKSFLDYARSNKGGYHCPYCGVRWSWNESEADRLRKALDARNAELRRSQMETVNERQLRETAERRALDERRKLRRVERGVCACCNRSFTNLRRHMATAHGVKNGEPAKPKKP